MANTDVRIRSYNVGFGDCFLLQIPDGNDVRRLMIDFGNAPGRGGTNKAFPDIAADIKAQTGGRLDVIVMTHEHLDHMEGFYSQKDVFNTLDVDQVWMSIPSDPNYYREYPKAKAHKRLREAAFAFEKSLRANGSQRMAPSFETLLRNNLSNVDRIEYLRNLPRKPVRYLRRGSAIRSAPASKKVKFRILAPEKDMSDYYAGGRHRMNSMTNALRAATHDSDRWSLPRVKRVESPPNLSQADWFRLRNSIQSGAVDAVRSIDRAQNNTSLVFLVEVGGKRLLFTGDAELESWDMMKRKAKRYLGPVDFLKISHHGSHNGTPLDLLDTLLPVSRKDKATVMVSTKSKVYGTKNPVPDEALLIELKRRCKKLVSTDGISKKWVEVKI